jgi:hypothetical protein
LRGGRRETGLEWISKIVSRVTDMYERSTKGYEQNTLVLTGSSVRGQGREFDKESSGWFGLVWWLASWVLCAWLS